MSTMKKSGGDLHYIVGASGKGGDSATLVVVDNINARNALTADEDLVMVRDATADPTVSRGWALYLKMAETSSSVNKVWTKIAEQESVDGIWGVKAEILQIVATKAELMAALNGVTASLTLDYFKDLDGEFKFNGNIKCKNFNPIAQIPTNDPTWNARKTEEKVNAVISALNSLSSLPSA